MKVPRDTRLERFDWQVMAALREELIERGIPLHEFEYPRWRKWWEEAKRQTNIETPPTEQDLWQEQQYYDNPGNPIISFGEYWHVELIDGDFVVMVSADEFLDNNSVPYQVTYTHFRIPLDVPDSIERLISWLQHELPKARKCPANPKVK